MRLFQWLFGKKEEEVELPPEFMETPAPDWLIEMKSQTSSGAHFSMRTRIFANARKATSDIFIAPNHESGQPRTATVDLERLALDRLLVLLGFSFPHDIVSAPGGEGLPAKITIHRHEPYAAADAECNVPVHRLDSKKTAAPVVEIGQIFAELQRQTLPDG